MNPVRTLIALAALCLAPMCQAQGTTGATTQSEPSPIEQAADGSYVVKTTTLSKGVKGFKGTTPLTLTIKDDVVVSIKPLRNRETPEYFQQAQQMLRAWEGLSVDEALALQVDAVTGATLSCDALRENVRLGLNCYRQMKAGQ